MCPGLKFLSREDKDLGLALQTPRGVRPRLEGKQRTALSSRAATRISWSPLSGLKGVKPPLQFGERTRHCSPGQAGKEGPHLARTGASQVFPRGAAPVGVFSRGRPGSQGASRAAPGKSVLHVRGEGEHVIALESWEGTRASRRVEEGLSRSFSGCSVKPSFPPTAAGDLRKLPREIGRAHV